MGLRREPERDPRPLGSGGHAAEVEDHYFHADDLGSFTAATDASGKVVERYAYGDYGMLSFFDKTWNPLGGTAIRNPCLFTGRRYDPETGLYYYRTRYLDPRAGRFTIRDTIGIWTDPMKRAILVLTFIALPALPLSGQAIEDPEPHAVGWQDVSFVDTVYGQGTITGRAFQVAGSADWIVPPGMVHAWFEQALSASRNVYFLVEGMGHTGCLDNPAGNEPLPGPEQARLHRRLGTGLLRAEVEQEENLHADLLGEGMETEPVTREVDCEDPPFWVRESALAPGMLLTGLGAYPSPHGFMMLSLNSSTIPTNYGILGLDPSSVFIFYAAPIPAAGWCESLLPIPKSAAGVILFLQGAWIEDESTIRLTRTVEFMLP